MRNSLRKRMSFVGVPSFHMLSASRYDTIHEQELDQQDIWYCPKLDKNVSLPPAQWPADWKD